MPENKPEKQPLQSCPTEIRQPQKGVKEKSEDLPPIVRRVPDPPVPNRAHTEM
jgi:hypothetical protein